MNWIPEYTEASAAMDEGRFDTALAAVLAAFERMERGDCERPSMFFPMFLWSRLIERYPPARDAMARTRDAQLRRVLDGVNDTALRFALFPPSRTAPRLGAELSNFAGAVRQRAQALRGLGRGDEADALCQAALAGLANDELRRLAQAELDEDGAIIQAITAHRMRLDEQEDAGAARPAPPP